jgi:hypothetical protein
MQNEQTENLDNMNLLNPIKVRQTIEKLNSRINERFPTSGLSKICNNLYNISKNSEKTIIDISKTNYYIKGVLVSFIAALVILLIYTINKMNFPLDTLSFSDFFQTLDAILNEIILISLGAFSLVTLDTRLKRKRIITSINKLKSIAHIIDSHQLTKDPELTDSQYLSTENSPSRTLSNFELGRYLDYCTEMLSLTSKVGFLYVQQFDDDIASSAANGLETLTNGISQKIWQKLIILNLKHD